MALELGPGPTVYMYFTKKRLQLRSWRVLHVALTWVTGVIACIAVRLLLLMVGLAVTLMVLSRRGSASC